MFTEVATARDIETVAHLAREIWREHYTPIIGRTQVEYMLEKFQSAAAIAEQIESQNFAYFLIRNENENAAVGYIGLQQRGEELFLSKIYVVKSARGNGLGARGGFHSQLRAIQ